MLKYLCKISS